MTAAAQATVAAKLKEAAEGKGLKTVEQFQKVFNDFDKSGKGFVDENKEIAALLKQALGFTVGLTNKKHIIKLFDPEGVGKITLNQFISFFIADASSSRMDPLKEAWKRINTKNNSFLNVQLICENYDSEYIEIAGRRLSVEHFAQELVRCFDTDGDGKFDESDFLLFYKQLSDQIKSDDEWNEIINASWKTN